VAAFEAWLVFLILVVNVVGELQRKRTLAASRGFLAAARLSCSMIHPYDRRTDRRAIRAIEFYAVARKNDDDDSLMPATHTQETCTTNRYKSSVQVTCTCVGQSGTNFFLVQVSCTQ